MGIHRRGDGRAGGKGWGALTVTRAASLDALLGLAEQAMHLFPRDSAGTGGHVRVGITDGQGRWCVSREREGSGQ